LGVPSTHRGTNCRTKSYSKGDTRTNILHQCSDYQAKGDANSQPNCEASAGFLGLLLRINKSKSVAHIASTVEKSAC
jgi:hypothetical protein